MDPDRSARSTRTRLAGYALVVRDEQVLLSRLAAYLSPTERWTLPGGGVEFGEHPRLAVVREVHEETGLDVGLAEEAWVDSALYDGEDETRHAVRLVYEGWVGPDAPPPRVVEVGGSTADAAWKPVRDVLDGTVPVVPLVTAALERHQAHRRQRVSAYALLLRGERVLLTRISRTGHHTGSWTLPGGGVEHGESPGDACRREVREETGLDVGLGDLLGAHQVHFIGTAPSGRTEDYHGIHLVFAASAPDTDPRVTETDGTTDAAAWVSITDVESGAVPVLDVVRFALTRADPSHAARCRGRFTSEA